MKDRISCIKQQVTVDDKNDTLLDALMEVPDNFQKSVMNNLVSALRFSGQDHVANIFRRENDKEIMTDEHYELLSTKQVDLCQFLNPRDELVNSLLSKKVFSLADKRRILSKACLNDMADETIEVLRRKSDDAFYHFIDLLRQTGQSHVAFILTGKGKNRPLKEEHRSSLLTSSRDDLVRKIDSKHSGLIRTLMSKSVLSSSEAQRVTSVQPDTQEDRNEFILDLIARKSQFDFSNFITALKDTGQTHVVTYLTGAEVVAKIKTVYETGTPDSYVRYVDAELLKYMKEMFQRNSDVVRKLNTTLSQKGISVYDVRDGCIEIAFTCENVQSLLNFQTLNVSGELRNMLNSAFCPRFAKKGLLSLKLEICDSQFVRWIPTTSEHREALTSSTEWLVNKMAVTDKMMDELALCERRREAIESASTREQKVKTLIDVVSRQPDSTFTQLLNALNDTRQTEAADVIRGHIKVKTKSRTSELSTIQLLYTFASKCKNCKHDKTVRCILDNVRCNLAVFCCY